jgi:aspartyl protease family protein
MQKLIASAAAIVGVSVIVAGGLGNAPIEAPQNTPKTALRQVRQAHSGADVVLERRSNGHFFAEVEVNGTSIGMLADTGASVVALSIADAEAAGINVDSLNFSQTVSTANGDADAAFVVLDEVSVGSITRHNVTALVARGLSGSLLGMSFFNTLAKVGIEGDEMVLED